MRKISIIHIAGTQIYVFGLLPPGSETVTASYSIDNGKAVPKSLDASPNTDAFIGNNTYYLSPQLKYGNHTIKIIVENTGTGGRNFTLDYFQVIQPSSNNGKQQMSTSSKGAAGSSTDKHVGAIIGGILGAFAFLLLVGLFLFFRRRKIGQLRTQRGQPRMLYYGQSQVSIEEPRSTLISTHRTVSSLIIDAYHIPR